MSRGDPWHCSVTALWTARSRAGVFSGDASANCARGGMGHLRNWSNSGFLLGLDQAAASLWRGRRSRWMARPTLVPEHLGVSTPVGARIDHFDRSIHSNLTVRDGTERPLF